MSRPQRAWGVTFASNQNQVMPWAIGRTREAAIRAAVDRLWFKPIDASWRTKWKFWRGRGCRAVKVTIAIQES